MTHHRFIKSGAAIVALTIATALSACTSTTSTTGDQSGAHGSRVELYASEASLSEASSTVVVATVTGQKAAADITPETEFTVSTLDVITAAKTDRDLPPGSTVQVRQLGSEAQEGPAPLLIPGETYLLYLTPSGLEGDLSTQFYVTGGTAGLYRATSDTAGRAAEGAAPTGFAQVAPTEGEELPTDITLEEVTS
ncbi:hypothetical protein C5C71_16375 [Rathayibacter sp. AY1C1]|jgi:hypothetical protein|uniref:hypothetical protein n=1 Tax=Rathayibacter sp. AY1C1 TaxID=2080534 RepID=UPI000CE8C552|nr:hypothetical protein [Rathayibacter sp. AY1C1]PPH05955.1 hypothetical protein C5C71_16375 [Rathayibacter sp. AY1C1]